MLNALIEQPVYADDKKGRIVMPSGMKVSGSLENLKKFMDTATVAENVFGKHARNDQRKKKRRHNRGRISRDKARDISVKKS